MTRPWPGAAALLVAALVLAACSRGDGYPGSPFDEDPLATVPTTAAPPGSNGGYNSPVPIGALGPDVPESSGLVASRRNPGLFWTHNDSGDGPLIYCVGVAAAACGVWRVTGAEARDWEDIAAGPGPVPNTPYLYLADIGDNLGDQPQVTVYRVPEPAVVAGGPVPTKGAPAPTERAEALRLRYPDGPRNAEALLVHPTTGDLYVVSKEAGPGVYVARAPLAANTTTTMTKVANLSLTTFASQASQVTGGDISPDGRKVVLCNYVEALEYRLPADAASFDAIWQQTPVPLNVGLRQQGEAIAYRLDGRALLTTSEAPLGGAAPVSQIEQP